MLRTGANHDFYEGLLDVCNKMDIPVEGFHEETGPGQLGVTPEVLETSEAADNAALFKTFSKVYAQTTQRMISFMAKWHHEYSGQGGHIHVSLQIWTAQVPFMMTQNRTISATICDGLLAGYKKVCP